MKFGDLVRLTFSSYDFGTIMKIYEEGDTSLRHGGPDFLFGEVGLVLDVRYIRDRSRYITEGHTWVKLQTHRGVGWVREDDLEKLIV